MTWEELVDEITGRHPGIRPSTMFGMPCLKRENGKVVAVMPVTKESELLIITSAGKLIRLEAEKIRATGRSAQGVKLIDTSDGDLVASASLVEQQSGQMAEEVEK